MAANELVTAISRLRKERKAVILVHNYQRPEVQDIADFVGDSLGLSHAAAQTDAEVIVFCGVDFMAESAKVINPGLRVLLPEPKSRCPMAAMIDAPALREFKGQHPGVPVIAYVNTSAEVKAETDICCTSSNAVKVVKSISEKEAIFVPDTNLGMYVQRFVKDIRLHLWPGYCPTHHLLTVEDILEEKKAHPKAEVLAHPECTPEVIDVADFVYSTEGMVKHAQRSGATEFILGTERELAHRLRKENPGKLFHPIPRAVCPNMKKNTLQKVLESLETLEPAVKLDPETIERARKPLRRMMEIGRGD